jgi:hypothetical protein
VVRYQDSPCEICGGQSGTGQVFLLVLYSIAQIHPAHVAFTLFSYQTVKRAKSGNLPKGFFFHKS